MSSTKMIKKSTNQPDETRKFEKGKIDVTNVGDFSIGKATFEPGWKWSTHVKPIVGGNSCQVNHTMYVISGKIRSRMDDGSEQEFGPGDTGIVPPGHDAWVVGNEKFVAVDFTGAKSYAKKQYSSYSFFDDCSLNEDAVEREDWKGRDYQVEAVYQMPSGISDLVECVNAELSKDEITLYPAKHY